MNCLVAFIGYSILIWPFISVFNTALHELGHAIPGLIFTKTPVIILFGDNEPARAFRIGKRLAIGTPRWGLEQRAVTYITVPEGWYKHKFHILFHLGGPIVSFSLCVLYFVLIFATVHIHAWLSLTFLTLTFNASVSLMSTAMPFLYSRTAWERMEGKPNDALNALLFLRKAKEGGEAHQV